MVTDDETRVILFRSDSASFQRLQREYGPLGTFPLLRQGVVRIRGSGGELGSSRDMSFEEFTLEYGPFLKIVSLGTRDG